MKTMNVRLSDEEHAELTKLRKKLERSGNSLIREALADLFAKYDSDG